MNETLYSSRSNLVIGFHGCDQSVVDKVVLGKDELIASTNDYDWLGHGIYFWENNEARALQWAEEMSKRNGSTIKHPAVIGAVIDMGYCLDLTETHFLKELKVGYDALKRMCDDTGVPLPQNRNIGTSADLLLRKLDCAVIMTMHQLNKEGGIKAYDSVRGVFWEGKPLYPNAGFAEKNHIQISICNPNCIKGYFIPRKKNKLYPNP